MTDVDGVGWARPRRLVHLAGARIAPSRPFDGRQPRPSWRRAGSSLPAERRRPLFGTRRDVLHCSGILQLSRREARRRRRTLPMALGHRLSWRLILVDRADHRAERSMLGDPADGAAGRRNARCSTSTQAQLAEPGHRRAERSRVRWRHHRRAFVGRSGRADALRRAEAAGHPRTPSRSLPTARRPDPERHRRRRPPPDSASGGTYNRDDDRDAAGATRIERDSMGEMEVPADALYGASTQRAVLNFPISGERMPRRFLRALALIKLAAAETNAELGLLDPDLAAAIAAAAREVADGGHDDQFPIDIYQTGSGTSTNTNMNEVVAHLASARLGGRRGPPERRRQPLPELERRDPDGAPARRPRWRSRRSCCRRSSGSTPRSSPRSRSSGRSSRPAGPTSRTRRRSGSARSSAATPGRSRSRSAARGPPRPSCWRCPLGGTAVGTGINAHPEYAFRACARLSALTGLTVRETANHFHAQATLDAADRRPRRDPDDRAQPLEDRLGRAADGDGSARRARRARAAGDPAGLEHHARQGEPGHRREPDDGRRRGSSATTRRSRSRRPAACSSSTSCCR